MMFEYFKMTYQTKVVLAGSDLHTFCLKEMQQAASPGYLNRHNRRVVEPRDRVCAGLAM